MAYYSKYTGAELEEKLDKVEEIPQLIAQMITGKDFVTKEDLLCVLKDYAPADYRTIPIDNNTIYWENGVLKAATSDGTGQCQWELREHNGIQYLYSRLPVVTQYDVTMYADVNHLDLPSIYDGLPIDGDTIYWEETEDGKVLKAKSVGGSGENIDAGWVISVISNAGFATQNWVNNQNFINSSLLYSELAKYVKIKDYQEIEGVKNFLNGLQIAGLPITKLNGYEDVIYIDANVVVRGGLTMYSTGEADIPSLTDSIVTDGITILNDNGVLKINPDIQLGGITEEEMQAIVNLINTKWTTDNTKISHWDTAYSWGNHANAGYVTKQYVDDTFVTFEKDEIITGLKTFTKGIQIGSPQIPIKISQLQDDILYIDSNVVIRGGLTMYYEDGEIDLPTIKDEIGNAGYDGVTGLASFNSSQFFISNDGTVTIIGGSTGLDTAQLKDYLDSNKYTTETWVKEQGYASASSLSSLQTKVNNFLEGSDTDTIINKWKELEAFLSGLSESDNLAAILGTKANQSALDATNAILATKWTTDNNLINKWNTAYGWGDHSKVGYALKSYVDNTFVTIKGNEDVTGVHDFVNGLKIGNIKLSKSQEGVVYLEGNLVVKGGVTMYALDEVTVDSIIDSLPLASTSQYGIAKFNPSNFVINEDGFVTIIGGSSGLDTEELAEYLATNKYVTQGWVEGKGYITSSALNGYATQSWVTNQKYITGITSAMVVSALGYTPFNNASFTKSNIKSTLGISDWALASSKPSYNFSEIGTKPTTLAGYGITDAYTITQADALYAKYLPLTGGTLTGALIITNKNGYATLRGYGTNGGIYFHFGFQEDEYLRIDVCNSTGGYVNQTLQVDKNNRVSINYLNVGSGLNNNRKAEYRLGVYGTLGVTGTSTFKAMTTHSAGLTSTIGNFSGEVSMQSANINGGKITYDATNKYWKLEGDLLITGGVTMYGIDEGDLPSILDSLPIASTSSAGIASFDSTYFSVNASGKVTLTSAIGSLQDVSSSVSGTTNSDVVLFKSANSSTWTTKPLSEIGGGSSGGGSVSGDYLPLANAIYHTKTQNPDPNTKYDNWMGMSNKNTPDGAHYYHILSSTWDNMYWSSQLAIPTAQSSNMYYRRGASESSYNSWVKLLDANNYSSYALPLSGGTLTGNLTLGNSSNTSHIGYYINRSGNTIGLAPDYNCACLRFATSTSNTNYLRLANGALDLSYDGGTNWNNILHSGNISSYNAGSATKLQTARTIWGKSFDGTADITTGDITAYASRDNTTSLNLFKAKGDVGWQISGRYSSNQSGLRIYYYDKSIYNEYLSIGTNGNIGVHTNNAGYALDVNGGIGVRDGIAFYTASTKTLLSIKNSNAYGFYLKFEGNQAQLYNVSFIGTYGSQNYIDFGYGAGSNTVDAKTTWMRLIKGKLGIGTGDPSSSLHVIGDASIRDGLYMARASDNAYNFFIGKESGTIFQILNGSGGGEIHLRTNNSSTISSRVVIGGSSTTIHNGLITKANITLDKASDNNASINLRGTTTDLWQLSARYGTASGEKNVTKLYYYNGSTWATTMQITTAGNMTVLGGITMYSDQRKKTILNNVELTLQQIADAPLIEHYYNSDQDKTTHVGSIAQYWASLNDWFCKLDAEGFYTMEIQNCALASAISIARHLEKYESKTDKKIRQLKKRISQLEDELELLKKGV